MWWAKSACAAWKKQAAASGKKNGAIAAGGLDKTEVKDKEEDRDRIRDVDKGSNQHKAEVKVKDGSRPKADRATTNAPHASSNSSSDRHNNNGHHSNRASSHQPADRATTSGAINRPVAQDRQSPKATPKRHRTRHLPI